MVDRVTISNQALSLLGEDDQLLSPDDDTHAGRTIRAVWDVVRQAVLREGEWNFAGLRAGLAFDVNVTADAIYPYAHAYPLPEDFLRLIEFLDPPQERINYCMEGGRILADVTGPIYIRYVKDVPETGAWDAAFVDAFAHRLAYQIAERITGDRSRKADCWNGYRASIGKAIGADAVENPPVIPDEDDWVTARWTGPVGVPGL